MAHNCITTHQDCEFATEQLGAQGLFVWVDIDDALFYSCILILIGDKKNSNRGS